MTDTRINPESYYGAPYGGSYQPSDAPPAAPSPYAEQAPYLQAPPDAWNGGTWSGTSRQPVIDGTVSGSYRFPQSDTTGGIPMYGATGTPATGAAPNGTPYGGSSYDGSPYGSSYYGASPSGTSAGGASYGQASPYQQRSYQQPSYDRPPYQQQPYQQPAPQPSAYGQPQPPSYQQPGPASYQTAGYQTDPSSFQPSSPYPPPGAGYPPPPSTPPPGGGYGQRAPAGYPAQAAAATQTATPPPFPAVPGPGTPPPFPAVPGGPGTTSEPTLFRVLREREQQQGSPQGGAQTAPPPMPQAQPWAGSPRVVEEAEPAPSRAGFQRQQENDATSETAQVAANEDEKLLQAIKRIVSFVKNDSLFPRLVFIILGFTAIGPLAFAYIEAVPLPISAGFVLAPAVLTMIALGLRFPVWGRRALIGWIAGIAGTIIYDVLRLGLVEVGFWDDPIPAIGNLLLVSDTVPWWVGYAWRFMGNGGGMAIAFTMLPWRGVKAGLIYGTLINSGLFLMLYFFPIAQTHFFPFSLLTLMAGYAGHWTYGGIVGAITKRFLPPPKVSLLKT